jgi:topoisomerase IV subunit A
MAKKKITVETPEIIEHIQISALEDIMGERYATYAKYVIQDRAIPDLRDGLKPVQRRIIYAMHHSGNVARKPYRKCATSVGEVMGKYHPHGDASIYDALAHMSQPWKYRVPLIDFQGNNGSIDGDNPAAHRYTESRLAHISEELTRDIEKNTVDMQLTFDDSQLEPVVLPARFPNLLVNGTQGIAVAMATNIPPHNLHDVIEAVIYRLTHEQATIEDLIHIIKGPDFPTGGSIYQTESLTSIYTTGHGRVDILSRVTVKDDKEGKQLIVTEIPYGVIKTNIVKAIDEIRFKKIIDGITEVRDESDHTGLRIAIDLKKDANHEVILNYLYAKTELKSGFSANMVAIDKGHPITFNLLQYIDSYIDHQVEVVTRLSQFDLAKAQARLEIVSGLIKAISILDEVVKTIRASKDKQDAMLNLIKQFAFTQPQADAVVSLQLYKLTNTDVTTLHAEAKVLEETIQVLQALLNDRQLLNKQIIKDLKAIAKAYGHPRMTEIINEPSEAYAINKRELIAKEDVMIALSRDGYVKRSPLKSYRSSDGAFPGIKEGDVLIGSGQATTLDYVLAFTSEGNYLFIPVFEMQETKWKDEGKHINDLITLPSKEKLVKAIVVSDFKEDAFVTLLSKRGQIKKTSLSEFNVQRYSKPINCFRLSQDDMLVDVDVTNGRSQLLLITTLGKATYFSELDINPVGIRAGGVKAIQSLIEDDALAGLLVIDKDERGKAVLVSEEGHIRIFDINYLTLTARLGKVQYLFQSFKSDPHHMLYWRKIYKQEETLTLTLVLSNKDIKTYFTQDFAPVPIDKYAKKTLNIGKGVLIDSVYHPFMTGVDPQFPTYETPKKTIEETAKVEQISIFDESIDGE